MKRLISWFNILIKKRRELRRWQRIVTVLAAVITFVTTYALILPAITVERDNTGEVGGMYLEQGADQDAMLEENALEPADVSLDVDQENDAAKPDGDGDETTAAPAVGTLEYPGGDYNVILTYDETSGIPEGASLEVSEITADTDEYQMYLDEAKKAMGLTEEESLPRYAARFFDIKIMVDEQEFTPESGVSVEITYVEPLAENPDTEVSAVHFADEAAEAEVLEANTADVQDDGKATVEFTAESFSVYGVIYTVDFSWEVDGKTYDFSLPGGGFVSFYNLIKVLGIEADDTDTEADEIQKMVDGVESIEFSNPELLSVSKIEEDTTVGAIKEHLGLACEYSSELTQDQIDNINAQPLNYGDWVLISHAPFDTEETLTVTLKTGEVFTIQVTDAAKPTGELDPTTGYILYYKDGETYYVLKADGSTAAVSSTLEMDALGPEYQWTVTYVYVEDGIQRFNIRPYTDKSASLALNHPNQDLIGNGPNNITVVPTEEGAITYILGGYNNTKLKLQDQNFTGVDNGEFTPIQFYELEPLHQYSFNVQTNNSKMGKVSGQDSSGTPVTEAERFTTVTNHVQNAADEKTNLYDIVAVPDETIVGKDGNSKYVLDHWEFNGKVLYQGPNGSVVTEYSGNEPPRFTDETIEDGKLVIPENAGTLVAIFKEDENYQAQDDDKQGTEFSDMDSWLRSLIQKNTPISDAGTNKTAEVYDYENRIYRVDLTAQSNLRTINGNLDLGFVLDVSGSMKFPSKLVPDTVHGIKNIWQINDPAPGTTYHQEQRWVQSGYQNPNYPWNWIDTSHYETINVPDVRMGEYWGLDTDEYYYVIAESDTRATVFRIFYDEDEGAWKRVDSSYSDDSDNAVVIDSNTAFGVDNSGNTSGYQIYLDGDEPYQRRDYEQSSLTQTISSLKKLITALTLVQETSQNPNAKNPDSRIAWNTFCATINKWHPSFTSVTSNETIISNTDYAYAGGTRTDSAVGTTDASGNARGAYNFAWDTDNKSNYLVLITDGAPQYGGGQTGYSNKPGKEGLKENTDHLVEEVKENIENLQTDKNVKVITVGLSMDDVKQGREMLYDIADTVNGERMFYSAESGDQLEDILLHIIDTIMVDATVVGNVTDTIGEAFYPVDLETGRILGDNDEIDLYGNCVTDDPSYTGPRGVITKDGDTYKVEWTGQDIPKTGWHGTVYVKAREDFLGGNAVVTNNDDIGKAKVTATDYKLAGDDKIYKLADTAYVLDDNGQKVENTNYTLEKEMSTPRVNVNELYIGEKNSEWTVYLGTEVDPKEQVIALYNKIPVEENVKKGGAIDTNDDDLPDILIDNGNQNQYNFTMEESISDQRQKIDESETFLLKDLIKSLVNPGGSSDWWDYGEETLNWDELIRMANLENQAENTGFSIKYDKYGMRDDGCLNIKLTKAVAEGEKGIDESPHATTIVGNQVETYTLTVEFVPDYKTPPEGQGGTSEHAKEYNTGIYGTAYQGHAAGKENRNTTHKINVYAKPLDVLKLDAKNQKLAGAKFALYRIAKDGETPVESDLTKYDSSLTGDYLKISEGTSDGNGIVHLADTGNSDKTRLAAGETYYLIETYVPDGYERESAYKVVTAEADENGTFTDLEDEELNDKEYPFNWNQGVRIKVDDSVVPLDSSGNEVSMAGKQYLKDGEVAVFRTKVINGIKNISIEVEKKWIDENNNPLTSPPDEITFKVYRVSYKICSHNWTVTPPTCEENGSRTCTICGETEDIPALDHAWGEWTIVRQARYNEPGLKRRVCERDSSHIEEQEYTIEGHDHVYGDWVVTTPATCEEEGVMTRYCNICLEPDPQTQTIPAHGHDYKLTAMTPATCTEDGSKTYTCSHDASHTYSETIPKTGHNYGEWIVTTPATTSAPGVETRYCANDPTHTETRPIPQLPNTTTVTINVNIFNHSGNGTEYYRSNYSTKIDTYTIGSVLDITWTYSNPHSAPSAWYKLNATRATSGNYYTISGARNNVTPDVPKQDGLVSTYNFRTTVTKDLVIDICLDNSWIDNLPNVSVVSTEPNRASFAPRTLMKAGSSLRASRNGAAVLTQEQLATLLASYKTPEQAQGEYNVYVIEEVTPAYTLTSGENWKKTIDDLPRHDEEGNEYTYYVVETSPATGYITTYEGENSGLTDEGKVTITNKLVEVDIELQKMIAGTSTPLPGVTFTLTQVDENGNSIQGGIVIADQVTDGDGKIAFAKIVPGRYKLEETDLPPGYIKSEGPYFINVSADGTSDNVEGTVIYASVEGHTFTIENVPGAALPHTGGHGTKLIYMFGIILISLAGAGLVMRKRRKTA